jgi:hypothetical protein
MKPLRLTLAPLVLGAVLLIGTEQASAGCQLQWQPDPFGGSGGYLDYVCNDPSAPTGNAGSGGKKRKKPTHAAIVVSLATLNDGDLTFSGSYSAGYAKKRTAVSSAKRACRREFGGRCKPFATARNGWAALVATLTADDRLRVFGGNAKKHGAALEEATRKARAAFGGDPPHDIQRVRAVRSKPGRRR